MSKLLQLRTAVEELIASLRPRSGAGGPSNSVTIEGPRSLKQGIDYQWWISNFDSFSTYEVTVNSGNVSRSDDYINYKLPVGYPTPRPLELTLVRNGMSRLIQFPIEMVGIVPPDVLSVVEDQRIEGLVLTITLGAFSTVPAASDTHLSTSVEIATDIDFTNVVWSSLNNTTNKYTITTTALPANTRLYLRARFNGTVYPYSAWSNVMFRTDRKWVTSYSSSWTTVWGDAPTRTTSHSTQWITETYSVLEAGNRTTVHQSLTSATTSWDTATGYGRTTTRSTNYFSKVDSVTSKNTQWLTNGMRTTSALTGTSDYDQKTTSWDTQAVWLTEKTTNKTTSVINTLSRTTSYDTNDRKDTSWTTSFSTSTATSATTSWNTSYGTSHVTSYDTGGSHVTSWMTTLSRTTSVDTSWTTEVWGDQIDDATWEIHYPTTSRITSYTTTWNSMASRTTSDVVVTSHTTSYSTTYGTSQPTSWTTSWGTSSSTGSITAIQDQSRTTSITTSKHTAV